ncbi:hypothetical protein CRG98_012775 [Punica granatum]|uniref:Uncharacterized protein n=1 Tax=Punica granatum TaxID=22663 RepID=A0A2I0KE30_PUNGR|nr:hypothetical protein CRG98_012775 [Punica granatum]
MIVAVRVRFSKPRCYSARDRQFARAALGCMEERSSARVSGMGKESGEEGDIWTRTDPILGGSFRVSRAGLKDRVFHSGPVRAYVPRQRFNNHVDESDVVFSM